MSAAAESLSRFVKMDNRPTSFMGLEGKGLSHAQLPKEPTKQQKAHLALEAHLDGNDALSHTLTEPKHCFPFGSTELG